MQGQGGHTLVTGTKVLPLRKKNRVPCGRCGFEIAFRADRENQLCRSCRDVDPDWGK